MTARTWGGPGLVARMLLVPCVLIASGCEIIRDPAAFDAGEGPIAVHAMLVAGEPRVAVLVTRYRTADTGAGPGFSPAHRLVPVADAEVRVAGAGETVTLEPDETAEACVDERDLVVVGTATSLAPGCYTASLAESIAPGARYELEITLRDGTTVAGETTVPRPVTIGSPDAGATIEVRSAYSETDPAPAHALAWSGTGSGRAIRLRLEADDCPAWTAQVTPVQLEEPQPVWHPGVSGNVALFRTIDLTGHESVDVSGWYISCTDPPPAEIDGVLQLTVLDLGYAQYLDRLARTESLASEDASVGLTGRAVGVFTGTAATHQPIRLIVR